MQTNTGIDLRASILENLGGPMVSLAMLNKGGLAHEDWQPQQLFVIRVRDTQALTQALETLKNMFSGLSALTRTHGPRTAMR